MHIGLRPVLAVTVALVALSVVTGRSADPTYSAIQLQLADLLIAEERFPEALEAFTRAKESATGPQLFRARRGMVHSMLRLARFADAIDRGLWTPWRNSVQAELERLQNELIQD